MKQDITKTCRDCGEAFIFTAGEQKFFESKKLFPPSRCPKHRAAKKKEREASSGGVSGGVYHVSGGGFQDKVDDVEGQHDFHVKDPHRRERQDREFERRMMDAD